MCGSNRARSSAYQGDIDEGLADYPDKAFDYVILSQTLQETRAPLQVLTEMLRVGRKAIISFPNFGHWSVRAAMVFTGQAPKTDLFPYDWYDSPNIHSCRSTISKICAEKAVSQLSADTSCQDRLR